MIFYKNVLRMRIPYHDVYRIHQHLDFFIQEQCRIKIPYSFKIVPEVANNAASVFLRTAQPLNLAGEQKKEIFLKTGDIAKFTTMLAVIQHRTTGNSQATLPADLISGYVHKCLECAGFCIRSLLVEDPVNVIVKRKKMKSDPSILIPASVIHITGAITVVDKAEKALVYGIGKKRIFGFGFLESFRVNNDDGFF